MRASMGNKEKSGLADYAKNYTRLSLLRRKASALRSNPPRRSTPSSENLNSPYAPDIRIHIVQLASSTVATLKDKDSENVLAKVKRHVLPLIWWKNADSRATPGDEINSIRQSSGGYNDSQIPAIREESNRHRTRFSLFRRLRSSQTKTAPKTSTLSTSVDSMKPPSFHRSTSSSKHGSVTMPSQIRPSISQNITFSLVSTAEMEPADWPPLTAFPNRRLSGAQQMAVWQVSPSPMRTSNRRSDGAHNIEYGGVQFALLEQEYGEHQHASYVTNWLDGLPEDPPNLRRVAGVENLHELQISHTM